MPTKRRRLTRAEAQAETRTRLLDAAISVFTRRGLHDATLEEISEAAGYTRGAIYSNFKGKDDLLFTVFEERIEPRLVAVAERMIDARSAREQAEASRQLVHALLTEERAYLQLLLEFWGFAARSRQTARRFAEVRRRRRAMVTEMIEARIARRDGAGGPPPDLLAAGFLAMTVGVLFEALVDRELDAEELEATLFELVARGAGQGARRAGGTKRGRRR
jgi:AcrR family transcriptional regulator